MTKSYFNLYLIENFLRIFIEETAKSIYNEDYWDELTIRKEVKRKINERREEERKNKWLSLRGDSNIFYTDFEDLKKIISSNWELFKNNFPKEVWITSRLEDLYKLRNRIAHNSYLNENDQKTIETYVNHIYSQLSTKQRYVNKLKFVIKKEKEE